MDSNTRRAVVGYATAIAVTTIAVILIIRNISPEPVRPAEKSAMELPPAQTDWSLLPWLSREPIKPSKRVKAPDTVTVVDKPPPELGLGALPDTKKVTGTALLDAEEAKYNISSVMDMYTGDTRIHAVKLPAPVFGLSLHGEVGVYYGYKTTTDAPVVRGFLRQDLVRSKDFYAGGLVTLDSDGEAYAGVGARYSW